MRVDDVIPVHLLGNLWAQTWEHTYRHVVPYPQESPIDATPFLKSKLKNVKGGYYHLKDGGKRRQHVGGMLANSIQVI